MSIMRSPLAWAALAVLIVPLTAIGQADLTQYSPEYLGTLKRDAKGNIVVVPFSPASSSGNTAPPSSTRVIRVGIDQAVHTPSQAAAIARDGDTVEIEGSVYAADVAVWTQDHLTIRGVEGRPVLLASGASAEGKAIWVIRGGDVTIDNIEFRGAKVRDHNGAGIRFERGNLTLRNCRFLRNENGLLSADGDMSLRIENSEFGYNGYGDGFSHDLYVGRIKSLYVTGSYFHHANVGHLLKSRAQENHILYNRLTDETGGRASYEIDLPNGGQDYVIGNIIEQSALAENPNFIAFGLEGYQYPDSTLYVAHNTVINDARRKANLLVTQAGFSRIVVQNNVLIGAFDSLDGTAAGTDTGVLYRNNVQAEGSDVMNTFLYDFSPVAGGRIERADAAPDVLGDVDLTPRFEYQHPMQLEPILHAAHPGAVQ